MIISPQAEAMRHGMELESPTDRLQEVGIMMLPLIIIHSFFFGKLCSQKLRCFFVVANIMSIDPGSQRGSNCSSHGSSTKQKDDPDAPSLLSTAAGRCLYL